VARGIAEHERRIFEALNAVKEQADDQVLQNTQILDNESFFERTTMPMVIDQFKKQHHIDISANDVRFINSLLVKEYMSEFNNGVQTW